MAGWDLVAGELKNYIGSEEKYWSLFNFVFSDASIKATTYKFALLKSILDNLFNAIPVRNGMQIAEQDLFASFAENYWCMIAKYHIQQHHTTKQYSYSGVESIIYDYISAVPALAELEFDAIDPKTRGEIMNKVTQVGRKYVIGALYKDFEGMIYEFDKKQHCIVIAYHAYDFILKYKMNIEKLNYYAWTKFLEKANDTTGSAAIAISYLENAEPKRISLSRYVHLLQNKAGQRTCFYCGKVLGSKIEVDHFIPWSFLHENKAWNLVLSCPSCNGRKLNKLAPIEDLLRIEERNEKIRNIDEPIIKKDFLGYQQGLLSQIWRYAQFNGLKEFEKKS